jgi:hypothetical protein
MIEKFGTKTMILDGKPPFVKKRKGTKFITEIPPESGRCVSMMEYKGQVLLATEKHIYQLSNDKVFKEIKFQLINKKETKKCQKEK